MVIMMMVVIIVVRMLSMMIIVVVVIYVMIDVVVQVVVVFVVSVIRFVIAVLNHVRGGMDLCSPDRRSAPPRVSDVRSVSHDAGLVSAVDNTQRARQEKALQGEKNNQFFSGCPQQISDLFSIVVMWVSFLVERISSETVFCALELEQHATVEGVSIVIAAKIESLSSEGMHAIEVAAPSIRKEIRCSDSLFLLRIENLSSRAQVSRWNTRRNRSWETGNGH